MVKSLSHITLPLTALIISLCNCGCSKEYSYEGGTLPDVVIIEDSTTQPDTIAGAPIGLPVCGSCSGTNALPLFTWNFKNGNSVLCGTFTRGIINNVPLFGPSACSLDTGIIITAYFDTDVFDRNKTNISADRVIFEYYDNVKPSLILKSWLPHKFMFIIDQYIHQSSTAVGRFSGYAFTESGDSSFVHSGKFHIKLN
jgi:hypothetical protein